MTQFPQAPNDTHSSRELSGMDKIMLIQCFSQYKESFVLLNDTNILFPTYSVSYTAMTEYVHSSNNTFCLLKLHKIVFKVNVRL